MRRFLELVGLVVLVLLGFQLVWGVLGPLLGFAVKALLIGGGIYLGYRLFQGIERRLRGGGGRKFLR